ncbi:ARM repeat-containing protein [Serendipita vermifera]|nr:ARM repeat-containing protein [Serendipita vermifera]
MPSQARKRQGQGQGGKDPKKRKLEQTESRPRSIPVTSGVYDGTSSEEAEDISEAFSEDIHEEEVDDMEIDSIAQAKTSNGAGFESHKAQKELLLKRKASKPNASMMDQAKRIWALARQRNLSPTEREDLCRQLADVVRGKVAEVAFKHDVSRIIQTIVKYGRQEQRNMVALELKGKYKELSQSKYSKFLVLKLIRYCPKYRTSILSEFEGQVIRLLLHKEAGQVISEAFELYSNAAERAMLTREFYGKEVTLFEAPKSQKPGLHALLEGQTPERKRRILSALKDNLQLIFENSDKGAVSNAIVHCALWEYLSEIELMDDQTEAEKLRREMYELCQEVVAEMVHTKNGSQVVRYFLAYGTAKDRKQIIKLLKPHLERICRDSEAQLVLFTALDVIDDTKMVAKSILTDVAVLTGKLYMDANGRRSLLYPLIGRNTRHVTPAMISTLASTDSIREKTSKKDNTIRADEIRQAISGDMLREVKSRAEELIVDPGGSLLVVETLLNATGDKTETMQAILEPLRTSYPGVGSQHPIERVHTARMYKQLLQGGHWSQSKQCVETSSEFNAGEFAAEFIRIVGEDDKGARIVAMAKGNGTFMIAELCERVSKVGSSEDKTKLKRWLSKGLTQAKGEEKNIKGFNVLLEKIAALGS